MKAPLTREYSKRLGTLRPDQFQAALDRFALGILVSAEPAPGGLFGQNVFVTSSTGRYVLRGCPHWDFQFAKERFFARELHARTGAPVPHFYHVEESREIFGWSFAIMPRMPGEQYLSAEARQQLSQEDRRAIASAMGETLAELHSTVWPGAGEYCLQTDGIKPFSLAHADRVATEIRDRLQRSRKLNGATAQADADWLEGLLGRAADALPNCGPPTYLHHDYREGNALVQKLNGTWRVTGVFDLTEGYIGDGEEDLVRSRESYWNESPALAAAFTASYAQRRPPRSGWRERMRIYLINDRLVIWEFGQSHGWFKPDLGLRQWLEPIISGVVPGED